MEFLFPPKKLAHLITCLWQMLTSRVWLTITKGIMPLRVHLHTHEIFHPHEPYGSDKCPLHEFLDVYS